MPATGHQTGQQRSTSSSCSGAAASASAGTTGLSIRTTLSKPRERKEGGGVWGYQPCPGSPAPSRDVLRFIQSLDLSQSVTNPRRDLQNGYLVAEMLARFYPGEVRMSSFENGIGEKVRRDNWDQICKVCRKKALAVPDAVVEGTLKGSQGSALALLEFFYETVTGKKVQRMPQLSDIPGMEHAAAMAAPVLSFGEAAGGDAGALRSMKPGAAGGGAPTFGAPQTQAVGDAMALRRKFGAGG